MTEPVILIRRDERGIAELTFNRPAVGNAYNGDLIEALSACSIGFERYIGPRP